MKVRPLRFTSLFILIFSILSNLEAASNRNALDALAKSFTLQVSNAVPTKAGKVNLILEPFDNATRETSELVDEIYLMTKAELQKSGYAVSATIEEDSKTTNQRNRAEEAKTYIIRGTVSETTRNLVLSAKIFSLPENKVMNVVLSSLDRKSVLRTGSVPEERASNIVLQEVFKSDPLPLKILDVSIVKWGASEKNVLLLLTPTDLYVYSFEDNKLVANLKIPLPIDESAIPTRDSRGMLSVLYSHDKPYVALATDKSAGTYLLREEAGKLAFVKLTPGWILKSQPNNENPLFATGKLAPGKNYFLPEVKLLDTNLFLDHITKPTEGPKRGDLNKALLAEGKTKAFYDLTVLNHEDKKDSLLAILDLGEGLTIYDTRMKEVRRYQAQKLGSVLTSFYEKRTGESYFFISSNNQPESSDFISLFVLKDGNLKPVTRTPNYRGSVSAISLGTRNTPNELPEVIAVVENRFMAEIESTILIFRPVTQKS